MHSREVGTQMVVKFSKIHQRDGPEELVHRPNSVLENKWNDAVDEGFV